MTLSMLIIILCVLATHLLVKNGVSLMVSSRRAKKLSRETKPLPSPADSSNDAVLCAQWDARHLEVKMVEAGILEVGDMTVCDNENCKNCESTRRFNSIGLRRKLYLLSQERARKALADAEEAGQRLATVKAQREQRPAYWPDEAPAWARREIRYNPANFRYEAHYRWVRGDGRSQGMMQYLTDEVAEEIIRDSRDKSPRQVAINDPETGEYLGEFRLDNNGEVIIRRVDGQTASYNHRPREIEHRTKNEYADITVDLLCEVFSNRHIKSDDDDVHEIYDWQGNVLRSLGGRYG